jgi:hypothetical protein
MTIAPDGTSRLGLIVNGKFPGPVITASESRLERGLIGGTYDL